MMRIAINGFGRIGRNFLRTVMQDTAALQVLRIVAINIGPAKPSMIAHMFMYDSLMGRFPGTVEYKDSKLIINGHSIVILSAMDPADIDWRPLAIDWVVEASGHFTKASDARKHIQAGAGAVLITAPAHDEDVTIIPGVNDKKFIKDTHRIVSLGSCTTNAFLPMLKAMHDEFTVKRCFMTTIHAYTNTQVLLDVECSDPRRARAAAINIIPTSTGAMEVMGKVIPELMGCVEALALRVPVAKVSLIDLTFITEKKVSIEAINNAFTRASQSSMKNILGITMEPLVSTDFNGDSHSVVVDGLLTSMCGDTMGKAFGWYDNEWGYSERLKDFLLQRGA